MEWFIIIAVMALDQLTKYWIQLHPALHGKIEIIKDFFYLTYVRNTGAAWSMFSGHQAFLSVLAAVVIGGLLYTLLKGRDQTKLYRVSLCLMIGGAAGNLYDRLMIGAVRDFLDFYIFGYDFPVFNVADMALCIGVGLLFLEMLLPEKEKKA